MASGRRGFGGGFNHAGDPSDDPQADDNTGPVDMVAVRRDDELISAIAGDGPVATSSPDEYQLAMLLANWRAELVVPPLPSDPDLDTIFAAVNQEVGARQMWLAAQAPGRRGKLRLVRPIGVAAACIAVIGGLATAFSYSAHPGDPLWKVKQVVFSQQANSTQAQMDVGSDLDQAQTQLDQGNFDQAQQQLNKAAVRANDVSDTAARQQLLNRWTRISQQVRGQGPQSTSSAAAPSSRRTVTPSTTGPAPGHRGPPETSTTQPGFPLPQLPSLPTLPSIQLPTIPATIPGLPTVPGPPPGQGH